MSACSPYRMMCFEWVFRGKGLIRLEPINIGRAAAHSFASLPLTGLIVLSANKPGKYQPPPGSHVLSALQFALACRRRARLPFARWKAASRIVSSRACLVSSLIGKNIPFKPESQMLWNSFQTQQKDLNADAVRRVMVPHSSYNHSIEHLKHSWTEYLVIVQALVV